MGRLRISKNGDLAREKNWRKCEKKYKERREVAQKMTTAESRKDTGKRQRDNQKWLRVNVSE